MFKIFKYYFLELQDLGIYLKLNREIIQEVYKSKDKHMFCPNQELFPVPVMIIIFWFQNWKAGLRTGRPVLELEKVLNLGQNI